MKCRNVNTEMIFTISACSNISQALSSFGVGNDCSYMLVVLITPTPTKIELIRDRICGDELHNVAESLIERHDLRAVLHAYNIDTCETNISTLLDSIVTRISCNQVL